MKNVAVFFGGTSPEREVSCITGVLTVNSIDKNKYNAIPVFIDGDGKWYSGEILRDLDFYKNKDYKKLIPITLLQGDNKLYSIKKGKLKEFCVLSSVINCLHGEGGEDGSLYGIIKNCDIAFASPNLFASAVSMDKIHTKKVLKGIGVNTLPYFIVETDTSLDQDFGLNFPLIVKPALGGSSIGVNKAENKEQLVRAVNYALKFGSRAIIEPLLTDFIEINCAVYTGKNGKIILSECERPLARDKVLSFSDKYENGGRVFPADIPKSLSNKIKEISEKVYRELDFLGTIRIDYLVENGKVYLNEINAVPGSLSYYLFNESLSAFTDILTEQIEYSEYLYSREKTVVKNYSSGILSGYGAKGAKRL